MTGALDETLSGDGFDPVDMNIRPPRGTDEFRDSLVVNNRAWRAAYDDILAADALDSLSVPPADELDDHYRRAVETDERAFLLGVEDGEVVGFVDVWWAPGETKDFVSGGDGELRAIYVDPGRWGERIGTRLLAAGIERLPDDVDRVLLETLDGNDVGHAFYRARGFVVVGDSEYEVGGTAYPTTVYARTLDG